MKISFGNEPANVEKKIDGDFGSCFIQVKTPDLLARTRYWSAQYNQDIEIILGMRIKAVVGWREVFDQAGAEIPFNNANFEKAMGANEAFFSAVVDAVHDVFKANHTLTETQEKN